MKDERRMNEGNRAKEGESEKKPSKEKELEGEIRRRKDERGI